MSHCFPPTAHACLPASPEHAPDKTLELWLILFPSLPRECLFIRVQAQTASHSLGPVKTLGLDSTSGKALGDNSTLKLEE